MITIKPKEKTVKVLVSLKKNDAVKLKEAKAKTGQSQSEIIRQLIRGNLV